MTLAPARGARITQSDGNTGVRLANGDDAKDKKGVYYRAHRSVVDQGGIINERFYDAQGGEIERLPNGSVSGAVKLIYTTGNNQPFHTVPKQR